MASFIIGSPLTTVYASRGYVSYYPGANYWLADYAVPGWTYSFVPDLGGYRYVSRVGLGLNDVFSTLGLSTVIRGSSSGLRFNEPAREPKNCAEAYDFRWQLIGALERGPDLRPISGTFLHPVNGTHVTFYS
jgi:hypothetical protein